MFYCDSSNVLSPISMLHRIINMNLREADSYTYIICGRSGPTGKTWLCNGLKYHGFHAIELSEDLIGLVEYRDDKNHFIANERERSILSVLNELLKRA